MQDLFLFERTGITAEGKVVGRFRATGVRPKCSERLAIAGFHLPMEMFEQIEEID
jgi:pilus assembly protein CpaF